LKAALRLHHLVLAGLVLGALAGWGLYGRPRGPAFDACDAVGELFLRLLSSLMIPLVVVSLIVAVLSIGDPRKLGRIGARALAWFLASAVLAVLTALVLANAVRPGRFVSEETRTRLQAEYAQDREKRLRSVEQARQSFGAWEFVKRLVPKNPVKAMIEDPPDMLALIVFALLLGIAASLLPEDRRAPFASFLGSFNEVLLRLVGLVMLAAPLGTFGLMARTVATSGVGLLGTLLAYLAVAVGAMAVHFFGAYLLTVKVLGRMDVGRFLRGLRDVLLTGFSTSSSAATLPVNLRAVRDLGVPGPIADFCLTLGATVNMDGTAIFQATATLFIAQVYGIDLSLGQQAIVLVTTVLAAVGTAPIPGAGVVMLAVIMTPAGVPLEGIALVLGVDRFLDMTRTVVNVAGDAACAVMTARAEGELKA
jgi:Na+/H+-dicarboxylate symporter